MRENMGGGRDEVGGSGDEEIPNSTKGTKGCLRVGDQGLPEAGQAGKRESLGEGRVSPGEGTAI